MKKIFTAAIVLGVIVCGTSFAASTTQAEPERGYISVNTSANTEITPNVVEINIAVKTSDSKSMLKATTENKETSDKVYTAIKSMINSANGDFIKTADYNATPVYSYNSAGKKNFDKYEVSNNIIVHTKNIEKTGAIIDKAISLGATNINELSFSVSDYEKQCNDLLEIATEDKIHQDYRAKFVPNLNQLFKETKKAGAYSVTISGAGSSILALTKDDKNIIEKVSKAMHYSFKKKNINSVIKVLNIPTKGIIIN